MQTQIPDEIIVVYSELSDETALFASTDPLTQVIEIGSILKFETAW